jgi:hypothetical protein
VRLAYERNADRPVAYLDESYRGPAEPGRRFYILTAVVVEASERDDLRDGIVEIAGDDYWHTTDQIRSQAGMKRAMEMLDFLNQGEEVCVVSIARSIDANDRDLESARRESLNALLPSLAGGSNRRAPVRLAMLEQRGGDTQRKNDSHTRTLLTQRGALDRNFRMMQTSPRHEHLLWLPDLVCSSVRRTFVQQRSDMLEHIEQSIEYLAVDRSSPRLP